MRAAIFFLALAGISHAADPVGYTVEKTVNYTSIAKGKYGGELFQIEEGFYKDKALLVDVRGRRAEMGYDWGLLVGKQSEESYNFLMKSILGDKVFLQPVLEAFLDWQWNSFLSVQVPQDYLEEISGLDEGGNAVGVKNLGRLISRGMVLANVPSDTDDLYDVLVDELIHRRASLASEHIAGMQQLMEAIRNKEIRLGGMQCSMFAVWGSRTDNNRLFSARNLDWTKSTGIAKYKLVSVFHPEGRIAHATVGFAGLFGALAGLSAQGVSVHEANLEERPNSFRGFPWVIRLRYIMENAVTLDDARQLWESTNNTVGFNHMATSAHDAATTGHGAIVFETMSGYTAAFLDNDAREANAVRMDAATNKTVHIGFPLEDALWRTNNGFDPESIKHYQWNLNGGAGQDSELRYTMIHDAIVAYNTSNVLMTEMEAINITSILGAKGDDYYKCKLPYTDGFNVLSVTFAPTDLAIYAAWEDGLGDSWTPACCNAYVGLDMQPWFEKKQ